MARIFISITQAEIDLMHARSLRSREFELAAYDFEHASHEDAITKLGALDWDASNAKYKGLARDVMIARALDDGLDSAAIKQLSDLNALQTHKINLEAVKIERAKSERSYDATVASLPAGIDRDAALAKVVAEEAAAVVVK